MRFTALPRVAVVTCLLIIMALSNDASADPFSLASFRNKDTNPSFYNSNQNNYSGFALASFSASPTHAHEVTSQTMASNDEETKSSEEKPVDESIDEEQPEVAEAEEAGDGEKKPWYMPERLVFQTAAFQGFIAAGAEWQFAKHHEIILLFGYVPAEVSGVSLWQATLKYEWRPFNEILFHTKSGKEYKVNPFHIGFGVIYGIHNDLFVILPDQYPDGYYAPTALRFILNMGASIKKGKYTFFTELTFLDVGLIAYIDEPGFFRDNYDYWGLEGIASIGFGVKVDL